MDAWCRSASRHWCSTGRQVKSERLKAKNNLGYSPFELFTFNFDFYLCCWLQVVTPQSVLQKECAFCASEERRWTLLKPSFASSNPIPKITASATADSQIFSAKSNWMRASWMGARSRRARSV